MVELKCEKEKVHTNLNGDPMVVISECVTTVKGLYFALKECSEQSANLFRIALTSEIFSERLFKNAAFIAHSGEEEKPN